MIKTKSIKTKKQIITHYVCDMCDSELENNDENGMELQEWIHLSIMGGYASILGDGSCCKINLCQKCFKESIVDKCSQRIFVDNFN